MLFPSTGHAEENWATNSRISECSNPVNFLQAAWQKSTLSKKKKRLAADTVNRAHTSSLSYSPSALACLLD